jgi:hypothetical protein
MAYRFSPVFRAFTTPLPRSKAIFCAGPSVITTVSGDWDIALGSIIAPVHVNCRASRANAAAREAENQRHKYACLEH